MGAKQVEVVVVTKFIMKRLIVIVFCWITTFSFGQTQSEDSTRNYKKRVLEVAEIDFLMSMYTQEGKHSAVGGGIGSEKLTDYTPTIVVSIPLNSDDVLTVDAGISAYSSASSGNINPFDNEEEDDDDDRNPIINPEGSPWYASSGASNGDALISLGVSYAHSSDSRNELVSANISVSKEYDYSSIGFGAGYTKLLNQQNTELSIKGSVYLDKWSVIYPTELREFESFGSDFLDIGYFSRVDVFDQSAIPTSNAYKPSIFKPFEKSNRNSYTISLGFSQILSRNLQVSIFLDAIRQEGLLSTPYQRVYFADRQNYYIGQSEDISYYESRQNNGVFHLADDIERLPDSRFKIPIGLRLNYYLNEVITFRTYYRYYKDNWGLNAHTASIEMPVKLSQKFTVYPSYRYYSQDQADYFAPYDTHLSSEQYYTSDYDLSTFHSKSLGFGISYTDIFTKMKLYKLGLKKVDLRYQSYNRSDGLKSNIISLGFSFVVDK
jgi:hypothetical protein